jgi:hypothetical protein
MTATETHRHRNKAVVRASAIKSRTNALDVDNLESTNTKKSGKRKRRPTTTSVANSSKCSGYAPPSSTLVPSLVLESDAEVISRDEQIEIELPDVNDDVSPDDFLLKLVSAQYNVSVQAKPALSLENFFSDVSEEQIAAYNIQVVTTARNNDLDGLKKLHSEEGQRLDCCNRFGESLLNLACRRGFEDIVEYLLQQPDINVRISDDVGRTPLHDACWHPSPQLGICKWLIERDPSLFLISDKRGCTAFQYARPQHWGIWRQFLFDNRECLKALTEPEILNRLSK